MTLLVPGTAVGFCLAVGALALALGRHTRFVGLGLGLLLVVLGLSATVVGTGLTLSFQHVASSAPESKEQVLRLALEAAQAQGLLGLVGAVLVLPLPVAALLRAPEHDRGLGWALWAGMLLLAAYPLVNVVRRGWTVAGLVQGFLTDPTLLPTPATISTALFELSGAGMIAFALGSLLTGASGVLGGILYARRRRTERAAEA